MRRLAAIFVCGSISIGVSPTIAQQVPPEEVSTVPPIQILGFADLNYLETERDIDEGFVLGQLVGHVSAGLSERVTLFTELSATARPDQYRIEIERLFLRYDFSDWLKLSAGRYHTPINYWNTAFHHGLWLQTTVARPEMIRFGTELQPVHFVGLQAEGAFPTTPLGFGYYAGFGNGRGDVLSRGGDAGDVNGHRAWLAGAFLRPAVLPALQVGAGGYGDRASREAPPDLPDVDDFEFDETILSAHAIWTREDPEVIAEYARIRHEPRRLGETTDIDAFYLQAAYRLPGEVNKLKPYLRYEEVNVPPDDLLFLPFALDYEGVLAGVRFDFSSLAAIKVEYRNERFEGTDWLNSLYIQVAFAFGETGMGGMHVVGYDETGP